MQKVKPEHNCMCNLLMILTVLELEAVCLYGRNRRCYTLFSLAISQFCQVIQERSCYASKRLWLEIVFLVLLRRTSLMLMTMGLCVAYT